MSDNKKDLTNYERMDREVWCPGCKEYSRNDEMVPVCPKCKRNLITVVRNVMTGERITGVVK